MPPRAALLVPTGPAGTIGFAANPAIVGTARSLWLLGWLDWTDTAAPGGTTVFGPATAPLAWADCDLSATIGAIDALVYLRESVSVVGGNRYGLRRDGDPEDYVEPAAFAEPVGASTRGGAVPVGKVCGLVATASAGVIEHEAAAAQTVRLDLLGYTSCTIAADEVFAVGIAPAAWGTTLDLTEDSLGNPTGLSGESLAVLRFTARSGAGKRYIATRRNGDVFEYGFPNGALWYPCGCALACVGATNQSVEMIVSTDAAGLVEWTAETWGGCVWQVELIGFVSSTPPPVPPVVTGTGPAGIAVDPTASVTWETSDDVQAILVTHQLVLTDPDGNMLLPIAAGASDLNYDSTLIANAGNGFDCTTPDIPMARGAWSATGYCEDAGALPGTDTWNWTVGYLYVNRVWDTIAGDLVRWTTIGSKDTGGASYPGPGVWGVDTSDYVCEQIWDSPVRKLNRVYDPAAVELISWDTSVVDRNGSSYPGPGPFGATLDQVVIRSW
jgi:hypothetical protein